MHLRIVTKVAKPAQVEKYFVKNRSEEAYYSENQEFNGFWGGKGVNLLGLTENMKSEEFSRLCQNLHPLKDEQLTSRTKEKRRIGYDFNFNCPKSLSLLYAYTKDERIIQAVRQGIRDTMDEMEKWVATRVRQGGRNEDRITGSWAFGEFVHLVARPEGGAPDPHLHCHCYVFNVTWDAVEKKFKAAQLGDIVAHRQDFQFACAKRVEENLRKLGLEIVPTKDGFEIAGISRELNDEFSRRTKRVNDEAKKRGIIDPAQKSQLAALTRQNKVKDLTIPELEPHWWCRLTPQWRAELERAKAILKQSRVVQMSGQTEVRATTRTGKSSETLGMGSEVDLQKSNFRQSMNQKTRPGLTIKTRVEPTEHDRRAVAFAIKHLFERQSVVTDVKLRGEAFRSWCIGKATFAGIEQVIVETPLVRRELDGKIYITTEEVLAEEKRCIDACVFGKGYVVAMNPHWQIQDERLNKGQRDGVLHGFCKVICVNGFCFGFCCCDFPCIRHEIKRAGGEL